MGKNRKLLKLARIGTGKNESFLINSTSSERCQPFSIAERQNTNGTYRGATMERKSGFKTTKHGHSTNPVTRANTMTWLPYLMLL